MPAIVARAPTRLDFGGGWTDVPPYSHEQGGFVCNLAIARHATVRLEPADAALRAAARGGEHALADAALRLSALRDVHASITNDFPLGAGLGGSSAAGVAMMGSVRLWRAMATTNTGGADPASVIERASADLDRAALAEESRRVEVEELGIAGGRQDHYAAAFGGALALSFGDATSVRHIPLAAPLVDALESRCVVAYTGQSRISGATIRAVLDAYRDREPRVMAALNRMKALAASMADALAAGDLDALGLLVGEHWVHQRSLHPSIATPLIDEILARAAEAGAIGGKALGASGGGCVVLLAARGSEDPVRRAVAKLAMPLTFRVDQTGFTAAVEA